MSYTQEDFQEWIFFISDKMDEFTDKFAKDNHLILDYTIASLDDLERWILNNYSEIKDLIADKITLDRLTIYIGETFRKYIGGKWFMDLKNKKNTYYSIPVLTDPSYRGEVYLTPMFFATASINRNKGNYISGILIKHIADSIKTIDELVEFMEKEYYPFDFFSIGKYKAIEGLFLEQEGNNYIYGYSERGHKDIDKIFNSETEAVQYVLNQIAKGQVDNSHLVAWTWNNNEIDAAERELQAMFIPFERNDIPNFDSAGRTAYRIFVYGKNIKYLAEFKKKYRCDLSSNQ